ncbi:hypothetical protein VTL71DRAFT_590 [Oculimacula yallundae]|uniref:Uncharacterized protein n=1 Tax=Oculimacula yallundae TaxID=86028 RepID=A0ABR4D1E5_9HELO
MSGKNLEILVQPQPTPQPNQTSIFCHYYLRRQRKVLHSAKEDRERIEPIKPAVRREDDGSKKRKRNGKGHSLIHKVKIKATDQEVIEDDAGSYQDELVRHGDDSTPDLPKTFDGTKVSPAPASSDMASSSSKSTPIESTRLPAGFGLLHSELATIYYYNLRSTGSLVGSAVKYPALVTSATPTLDEPTGSPVGSLKTQSLLLDLV